MDSFATTTNHSQIDDNSQFVSNNTLELLREINTGDLLPLEHDELLDDFMDCTNAVYTPISPANFGQTDHLHRSPELAEMTGYHDFEVSLDGGQSGKTSWMYSPKLTKVFVKMDARFTIDVSWQLPPHVNMQKPMYLRAMVLYSEQAELDSPVMRCPNHRHKETSNDSKDGIDMAAHILRCSTLDAMYVGQDSGQKFCERLAVRVPLEMTNKKIVFEFRCQNSCSGINRRATAILFCLENSDFQLLGTRLMNFKVCSCPKRDKDKEEADMGTAMTKKRKGGKSYEFPPGKRPAKMTTVRVKNEPTSPPLDSEPESQQLVDMHPLMPIPKPESPDPDSAEVTLTITVPNKECAMDLLKSSFNITAGQMVTNSDSQELAKMKSCLRKIRKQMDELGCKSK